MEDERYKSQDERAKMKDEVKSFRIAINIEIYDLNRVKIIIY